MKQEENYIDNLFEAARTEEPHTSFEEVSETLISSTSPTLLESVKELLLKNINLNSLLVLSVGIASISTLWFYSLPNEKEIAQTTPVTKSIIESSTIQEERKSLPTFIENKKKPLKETENTTIHLSKNEKKKESIDSFEKNKNTFLKEKTTKNIEKTIIPQTPKSTVSSSISSSGKTPLIEKPEKIETVEEIEKTEINNKRITTISEPTPESYNSKTEAETVTGNSFSPWVSEGSGGNNEMEWSINQRGRVKVLNEKEKALKVFMGTHYLDRIFEKNPSGEFNPLTLVSNALISVNDKVTFLNKKVRVIEALNAPEFDPDSPFINVSRFKVKNNKAILKFNYKDYDISMQLRKKGNGDRWIRTKLKIKNKNKTEVNIRF